MSKIYIWQSYLLTQWQPGTYRLEPMDCLIDRITQTIVYKNPPAYMHMNNQEYISPWHHKITPKFTTLIDDGCTCWDIDQFVPWHRLRRKFIQIWTPSLSSATSQQRICLLCGFIISILTFLWYINFQCMQSTHCTF